MAIQPAKAQTLDAVRERGFLICGATNALPGFAQADAEGRWSGFDVDLCRAIAAAVFGNPDLIEFRSLRGEARFAPLQTEAVDVLTRNGPWTQRRDTIYGATYVGIAFFDGQALMVPQALGAVSAYELDNVSICVIGGGDELGRLQEFFFTNQASYSGVPYEDIDDLALAYRNGFCDAISRRAGSCRPFGGLCLNQTPIASCQSAFPRSCSGRWSALVIPSGSISSDGRCSHWSMPRRWA